MGARPSSTVLYLWAGYVEGWTWTGLSSKVTLWDWLEGLALPATVGLVPLLLRHRGHSVAAIGRRPGAWSAFAALVLAGYLVPLGLDRVHRQHAVGLAEPRPAAGGGGHLDAVATLRRAGRPVTRRSSACGGVVAALVVAAGYLVPWAWTGFTGNTAWDWIKLLLLPVLLPTFVLPRLLDTAEDWMTSSRPTDPVATESRSAPSTG